MPLPSVAGHRAYALSVPLLDQITPTSADERTASQSTNQPRMRERGGQRGSPTQNTPASARPQALRDPGPQRDDPPCHGGTARQWDLMPGRPKRPGGNEANAQACPGDFPASQIALRFGGYEKPCGHAPLYWVDAPAPPLGDWETKRRQTGPTGITQGPIASRRGGAGGNEPSRRRKREKYMFCTIW